MGRPFLDEAQDKLRGTEAHTSMVAQTSAIPVGRPKWPKNLPKEARACFKRVCRWLGEQGRRTITEADREIVAIYAAADHRFWRFHAQLETKAG